MAPFIDRKMSLQTAIMNVILEPVKSDKYKIMIVFVGVFILSYIFM